MQKQSLLYGVIGLLAGALLAGTVASYAVNNSHQGMMKMMGMNMMTGHTGMSMDDMVSSLQGKTGDDFDKAFITSMIEHHEGAIDMARLAKDNAKHDEIKKMAGDIMSAQSKEIDLMQTWQGDWGYKSVPKSHMMSQ